MSYVLSAKDLRFDRFDAFALVSASSRRSAEAVEWVGFLIRDRDGIYGTAFQHRLENMDIEEVLIAPPSRDPVVAVSLVGGLHHRYRRAA